MVHRQLELWVPWLGGLKRELEVLSLGKESGCRDAVSGLQRVC